MFFHSMVPTALFAAALFLGQEDVKNLPDVFMGQAFVFEADLAAGRAAGTLDAELEDPAAMEAIAASLRARILRSGRFVEGQVLVEDGARVSVTFVGPQQAAIEQFLKEGLVDDGRMEFFVTANEGDLPPPAGGLAAERQRFERWRAAHPEVPPSGYDIGPGGDDGAPGLVAWRPAPGEAVPVALLRSTARTIHRAETGKVVVVRVGADASGFHFAIDEEALPDLRAYVAEHAGRELAIVVNGVVRSRFTPAADWDGTVTLAEGFGPLEVRAFLFAFAGEPLAAPLHFVELGKRPLLHVKVDGVDPDVVIVPLPDPEPK